MGDNAPCIALPRAEAANFIQARGYSDIDPRNCWEDWQQADRICPSPSPEPTHSEGLPIELSPA